MKTLVCVFLSFLITLATPTITFASCVPDYEGPCNDTVGGPSKNNEGNLIALGIALGLGIWYFNERHASEKTFSVRNNDIDNTLEAPQRFTISSYSSTGGSIGSSTIKSSDITKSAEVIESIGLEFTYKF